MSEPDYIERLRDAIRHTHGCASAYVETVPVKETFKGKTVWEGDVEVFNLTNHATARQCFAWGYQDDAERWQYVAVLKAGPVDSPHRAVQAFILSRKK